jgi:cyclohexyl-isocyanide hydratase
MRWIFHVVRAEDLGWGRDGRYAPTSLGEEGFIHASYKDRVAESARLYFPADARLRVLAIDPRRLDVGVRVVETPRGPMPHVEGSIPFDAIKVVDLDAIDAHPDRVTGTKIGFLAFAGMTLLDLVGPLDALSRIAKMGFDATTSCEVVAVTRPEGDTTTIDVPVWSSAGLYVTAERYRPPLDAFDVLVVPGGPGTRALEADVPVLEYLRSFPANRLLASVCTGSLVLGAAGRLAGKRATTHATALSELVKYGATPLGVRVVDEGQVVTAAGVTAGIQLGIHLVRRLAGDDAAAAIAKQMEVVT